MKSLPETAFVMFPVAQLSALKRSALVDAVSPAPREMVDEDSPLLLEFEAAVVSFPASAENSKVKYLPPPLNGEGEEECRKGGEIAVAGG